MKNLKAADLSMDLTNSTIMVPPKLGSPSDAASCISSAYATASVKERDFENESTMPTDATTTTPYPYPYPTDAYYGYYYPGYTEQGYYMGGEGMELQYPVMQADNGSLVYLMPGIPTSYGPYSPYAPVTAVAQQPYSPSSMFQPAAGYIQTSLPYGEIVPSPYLWDPSIFIGDGTAFGQSYYGVPETPPSKPIVSSTSHTPSDLNNPVVGHGKHTQSKTSSKILHGSNFESDVFGKGGYLTFMKHPLHSQGKGRMQHLTNPVSLKANRRAWGADEKVKSRNKVCSVGGEVSLQNDQNQGPRTASVIGFTGGNAVGPLAAEENKNRNTMISLIRRDQYSLPDFSIKYDHALFFVIKSYSEDDIHKSIKYNVWASTPNGNKRLDSAYQDAERKTAEKGSKCPVFLFFSVNASGQFCGVAEMIGGVNFNKSMDFWQQDKWSGYFPVKWHIIKDVPNPQLRHIILENNDNKPVTNSRDTQEVRFPQGIEMLNIFKNYESKTSILDDFDYYESRQKVMQERKVRPSIPYFDPVKQQKVEEISSDFQSIDLSGSRSAVVDGIQTKAKE